MKLRIYNNAIRLRLQQSEMTELETQQAVVSLTHFPNGKVFRYKLLVESDATEISAVFEHDAIVVSIPVDAAKHWFRPTQVGLDTQLLLEDGSYLKVLLEKDFKCLTDRPEEDESDAFPNPLSGHNC